MGNRRITELYQQVGHWGFIYDKETPLMRQALHRATRRKAHMALAQGEWDALPEPRRTQGWNTW